MKLWVSMNNNQNFEALDIISLLGFIAQIKNIEQDNKETNYIHAVIKSIFKEIEKLHQENEIRKKTLNESKLNCYSKISGWRKIYYN